MEAVFYSHNTDEMQQAAPKVINSLPKGVNLILLRGELGAGKTTFTQGALAVLGAEGPFTSPTFVIIKKYETGKIGKEPLKTEFKNVYHFDCYRVDSTDILELGWEQIIKDKSNLVFVEWPERIWDIISKGQKYCLIDFEVLGYDQRKMKISFLS